MSALQRQTSSQVGSSSQVRSSQNYLWNKKDVLGHGATCEVYKAYHRTTGEPAAVKVFNKSGVSRDMYQQQRELQLVRKLEHKNLVKVLAIEQEEESQMNRSIVVMELCEGRSLFCFLSLPVNRYGLEDKEFIVVIKDVTEGVKYLRENHVVHRDIKPGNIMRCINEDGSSVYKLTDFGGARELEEDAVFMSLHGTEEYLHPDIYKKALIDKRAPANFSAEVDLWSLGATFYHAAAGQTPFRPFRGRNDRSTMMKMTLNKEFNVISGQQKTEDGPITYSKELPVKSPMSPTLKKIIEPILGKLLESNSDLSMGYPEFFDCVNSIQNLVGIDVLNIHECQLQRVYMSPTATFNDLKTSIEQVTGFTPENQLLLTERSVALEHLEKDFLRYNQLYVLSRKEKEIDTIYSVQLPDTRFSKNNRDIIDLDYNLSYAMCHEGYIYKRELNKCFTHCKIVANAIQSLVDYCEDSPLEMKMSELTAKSLNLEARRRDILTTNEAFIKIIDLLTEIFLKLDPSSISSICRLSPRTLKQFQSVLTPPLMSQICNKLQVPCVLDFNKFLHSIETFGLKQVIQVLREVSDIGIKDFLTTCLANEVHVTYIVSILETTKSNLAQWAKQKINSGSNIDEQLHVLVSKIREIQENSAVADSSVTTILTRMSEMTNIMANLLTNMTKIHQDFEFDKKQKVRVTSTVKIMHQLHRCYLDTLKKRAFDVAQEAITHCNNVNKCLIPRLEGFIALKDTLHTYNLEYKQDFDMLSEYENNIEQWRSHMFGSVAELAAEISAVSLPELESSEVKSEMMRRLGELEETNLRNRKLCKDNSEMLQQIVQQFLE